MVNGGEVSVPVVLSPLRKVFTSSLAEVAGDLVPRIHVGLGGPVSECFAGDLPVAVAAALEVGDEDVFGGDTGSGEEEEARAKTQD